MKMNGLFPAPGTTGTAGTAGLGKNAVPKVSVVIPAYNARAFLPQTLASALAQTYTDLEVLIVNDGSSDGTSDWLAQLDDPRVRYLNQANLGQPGARNTGIAHTTGAYLAFLDADDLWAADKLEKQLAYLEANPEVGLIHTSVSLIGEQGDSLGKTIVAHGHGHLWHEIAAYNPYFLVLCGSTPVVRRSCFEAVGVFDETLRTHEDWDMWIRIAEHYPFATLAEPLVFLPATPGKRFKKLRNHDGARRDHYRKDVQGDCPKIPKAKKSGLRACLLVCRVASVRYAQLQGSRAALPASARALAHVVFCQKQPSTPAAAFKRKVWA